MLILHLFYLLWKSVELNLLNLQKPTVSFLAEKAAVGLKTDLGTAELVG